MQATVAISLGVLLTYASAWSIEIWTTSSASDMIVRRPGGTITIDLPGAEWKDAIGTQLREYVAEHPCRRFERIEGTLADMHHIEATFGGFFRKRETVGWPMAALGYEEWSLRYYERVAIGERRTEAPSKSAPPRTSIDLSRGLLVITPGQLRFLDEPKKLPWHPLWPGFAVDALLGAAIAWTLLFGLRSIRRWRRARRGACVHCGHHLVDLGERCQECGR